MSKRVCPLNKRTCHCDSSAADKKLHPCALAKRVGKFMRLLGSSFDGEAISAATSLRRLVASEGLAFNDLATLIENCDGAIEERKYSDADAEVIFARGTDKGRAEEARRREAPPEFYDPEGRPRWNEIALFCRKHIARLYGDWERTFITDMAGKTLWREPTDKQAKHLIAIFVKLGGYYDNKTVNLRR
jgi:hypothetical protein